MPTIREYSHPTRPGVVSRPIVWPERHGCEQEREADARRAVAAEAAEHEARRVARLRAIERAGLVGWLGAATFETYRPRTDWGRAVECLGDVRGYAYALLNGALTRPWLILYGSFGTGKSHLAAALVRHALEAGWRDCYFRVWTDYLRRLQASWRRRDDEDAESEADIVAELQHGRLVVIDDLDKRRPTDWTREVLFSVINHRYNAGLPTVLTFNYGPEDADPQAPGRMALEEYLGGAVLDRLIQSAFAVVDFDGPSYRSGVEWKRRAA